MTVTSTISRTSDAGNGTTKDFAFPYKFFLNADLVVILQTAGVDTVQTINTHYTVAGAGAEAGGTVSFLTAPAVGTTVVIYRDPAIEQQTDYTEGDAFPVETVEKALDLLTMIGQRSRLIATRSPHLVEGDSDGSGRYDFNLNRGINVSDPVNDKDVANKEYIQGQILAAVMGNYGGVISPFMANLLDDANPPAVLITLGFSTYFASLIDRTTLATLLAQMGFPAAVQTLLGQTSNAAFMSQLGLSPYIQTFVPAANAAAARTTLGVPALPKTIGGLEISRNGANPTTRIDFSAGVASNQGGSAYLTGAVMTKRLDVNPWAAGTGNGGRPTAVALAANTWYHCFIVDRSTGAIDYGFDTSVVAANLLAETGGTNYHMVGSILTDAGSLILDFVQYENWFFWPTLVLDQDTTITTARALLTARTPPGIKCQAKIRAYFDATGAANVVICSPDEADGAPSITAVPLTNFYGTSINEGMGEYIVFTDISKRIAARSTLAATVFRFTTVGYQHPRGRW